MIVRQWSGRAAAEQRGAYPAHFRGNVLPGRVWHDALAEEARP